MKLKDVGIAGHGGESCMGGGGEGRVVWGAGAARGELYGGSEGS